MMSDKIRQHHLDRRAILYVRHMAVHDLLQADGRRPTLIVRWIC